MLPTVIKLTRAEVRERRASLLDEVGMDFEELRDRAARCTLSMDELMVFETIEGYDYLLDGLGEGDG